MSLRRSFCAFSLLQTSGHQDVAVNLVETAFMLLGLGIACRCICSPQPSTHLCTMAPLVFLLVRLSPLPCIQSSSLDLLPPFPPTTAPHLFTAAALGAHETRQPLYSTPRVSPFQCACVPLASMQRLHLISCRCTCSPQTSLPCRRVPLSLSPYMCPTQFLSLTLQPSALT